MEYFVLQTISFCQELGIRAAEYSKLIDMLSAPEYDSSSIALTYFLAEQCENITIPHVVRPLGKITVCNIYVWLTPQQKTYCVKLSTGHDFYYKKPTKIVALIVVGKDVYKHFKFR